MTFAFVAFFCNSTHFRLTSSRPRAENQVRWTPPLDRVMPPPNDRARRLCRKCPVSQSRRAFGFASRPNDGEENLPGPPDLGLAPAHSRCRPNFFFVLSPTPSKSPSQRFDGKTAHTRLLFRLFFLSFFWFLVFFCQKLVELDRIRP